MSFGFTSHAELLDFGIAEPWSAEMMDIFRNALPGGIEIVNVFKQPQGLPSIGSFSAFLYKAVRIDGDLPENIQENISKILAEETITIHRITPKKARTFNARPGIWRLESRGGEILMGLRREDGPVPRVEEVISLLMGESNNKDGGGEHLTGSWEIERLGMWWEIEGIRISPLGDPEETTANIKIELMT